MRNLDRKIPITVFKDLGAKSRKEHSWSMLELLDEIERTIKPEKRDLPLLKLATFGETKTDKGSLRHDQNMITVSGIEGDYDLEEMSPEEAARRFKKANICCVIYTSASHTPDKPRWRVIAPFSDELLPRQRNRMLSRLNGIIDGAFSHESFTLSQAFYFGDVKGKHPTECFEVEGDFIDQRDDLDDGAVLPELVKAKESDSGERESTAIDEAQELFDRDYESGKLQDALEAALEYRWQAGDSIGSDEDRELWWRNICWAIHHGSGGDKTGYKLWEDYASRSYRASRLKKRGDSVKRAIATEWHYAKDDRPAGVLGFGTVYKQLEQNAGWVYGAITVDDFDDEESEDDPTPAPKPAEPKEEGVAIPKHLLTIPGTLGVAVDHYNACSTRFQPQFAVQVALALGSVALGRHWVTESDNYTSLYLVNLGATGRGKEFGRTFLERVFEEANMGHLVGPMKYASEAAVMGELAWKPRHVTVYDEFGRLLSSTNNSGNTNLREAQTLLMSLFGQLGGVARPTAYSTNGKTAQQIEAMRNQKVVRPAVTLLGLSTPETFFDALSQDDVANGFLNRLLVVNSRQRRRVEKPKPWKKVPRELISWLNNFSKQSDDFISPGESPTEVEDAEVVEYTNGALRRLDGIEQEVIDLQEKYEPMRLDGMFSRSREIAMRIALIVTLSRDKQRIDEVSLNWAWDYVRFYTMEMLENTQRMMGASPAVRIAEHIAAAIIAAGKKGMTPRDMFRVSVEFARLDKRGQDEVVHRLKNNHDISFVQLRKEGRGRPSTRYVHNDFVQ